MPLPGQTGTRRESIHQGFSIGVLEIFSVPGTAVAGAVTVNGAGAGIVTTEALTTAAGAQYTLTLTNNEINFGGGTSDQVNADVCNGTSTTGTPSVTTVTEGTGSVVIVIQNVHASAAFNGTLKVKWFLVRAASDAI